MRRAPVLVHNTHIEVGWWGRGRPGVDWREVNQVCVFVLRCCGDRCICICFVKESTVSLSKTYCGSLFQSLMVRGKYECLYASVLA